VKRFVVQAKRDADAESAQGAGSLSMVRFLGLVILVLAVAACGKGARGEDSSASATVSETATRAPSTAASVSNTPAAAASEAPTSAADPASSVAPESVAAALQFGPGRNDYTIEVDGQEREFIVHVPASYVAGQPAPLVFMFHGTSQNGEKFWQDSGWKEKGEAEGIITVYPTALRYFVTDDNRIATKWTYSEIDTILRPTAQVHDDVEFVRAMVARIEATWDIDPARVYATGFSNGGSFTESRLLMEMPDVFAAVAVAGSGVLPPSYHVTPSEETSQRSLYILIGTNDDKVFGNPTAVASGITDDFPSTPEEFVAHPYIQGIFGRWFSVLELDTTYTAEVGRPLRETLTFDQSLTGAPNELRIRVVRGMFHIYPGPSDEARIGFQACDLFWDFFREHPLGG
jgi:polyhydroxybutyrate depolymerase